jgi:hypothetical protein
VRTCRSCWGTVLAPTGRISERRTGEHVYTLTWFRCQTCFCLSATLSVDASDAGTDPPTDVESLKPVESQL